MYTQKGIFKTLHQVPKFITEYKLGTPRKETPLKRISWLPGLAETISAAVF